MGVSEHTLNLSVEQVVAQLLSGEVQASSLVGERSTEQEASLLSRLRILDHVYLGTSPAVG